MKALAEKEIRDIMKEGFRNWAFDGTCISRTFRFSNFVNAFAFMTSVAIQSEKIDHHPDWSNIYNTVNIKLNTHDAHGITSLDFDLAKTIDNIYGNQTP
jgi:4a-hydroxytetrahydrobiopterin dehydratase